MAIEQNDSANDVSPTILADKTPEELAELGKRAQKVMNDEPDLQEAGIVMRESRRIFQVAAAAMSRRMNELGHDPQDGIEVILRQSMMHAASQPFERQDVVQNLQRSVIPFLANEVVLEKARVEQEDSVVQKQASAKRKKQVVPLGFVGPNAETAVRGRTYVFIGHPAVVARCLKSAIAHVVAAKLNPKVVITHFQDTVAAQVMSLNKESKVVVPIGMSEWMHTANSRSGFGKFIAKWQSRAYGQRTDMLVVDDLAQLASASVAGVSPFRLAANAHLTVNRWAAGEDAVVLAGLPLKEMAADAESEIPGDGYPLMENVGAAFVVWEEAGNVMYKTRKDRWSEKAEGVLLMQQGD